MKVWIVGRTKMGPKFRCIGGLTEDGVSVRLLKAKGQWDVNSPLQVGQVWDLDFDPVQNLNAPHTEDIIVKSG